MSARHFLQSNWQSIAIAVTVAAVACAFLVIWLSMPPHAIVMATGPEGGTYYELGERYRTVLARSGVEVRLVPTAGSVENLAKLLDPRSGVSLALMQGGIAGTGAASELKSLGTMFYEPYWWFRRVDVEGVGVASVRGRKISIGPEGSGTRALSLKLLTSVGIDGRNSELLALAPRETAERLSAGDIDVAFLIASWDSPVVRELIADSRIALSGYPRADALVALNPFLSKLTVPRGAEAMLPRVPAARVTRSSEQRQRRL